MKNRLVQIRMLHIAMQARWDWRDVVYLITGWA